MKQVSVFFSKTAILFILFYAFVIPSGIAQPFNFQTWNNANTPAITVTGFQSVTIDKRGKVWAGSTLGGLYCYRDTQWVKINTYPDVTFRHGVPSNMPGDSNVWITSIGKSGVQATTGGAYLINTQTETVTQYGSGIAGGLGSRYANSLALSSQGKVYVALAQSTTAGNTNQGGVYVSNTVNPPPPSTTSFSKAIPDVGDIIYHSAGNRGDELWFGRGPNCAGGCTSPSQAPYIARLSSSGTVLSSFTAANSGLPFTASGSSAFPRAIFTDETTGNTFVGLNSGGIGVYKSNNTWKMLTSANSPFPASTAVNFNAIAEVFGEVWFGTTSGIFVYNGTGSLDSMSSFKMITTADGLPSNSITDIAVDTIKSQIWVTSPVGISMVPYIPPFIKGVVYDVHCNRPQSKPDSLYLFENLQKKPLSDGVIVKLIEGSVIKEVVTPDKNGAFKLINAEDGKDYTIEIRYNGNNGELVYNYNNVKNHKDMKDILFPDGLISEIKDFKSQMKRRCFNFNVPYYPSVCRDGFDVSEYDNAYEKFKYPNIIETEHKKRVENLANFYMSSAAVYNIGAPSTELANKAVLSILDVVEAMTSSVQYLKALKNKTTPDFAGVMKKLITLPLNIIKDNDIDNLNKIAASASSSKEREFLGKMTTLLEDAANLCIKSLEEGADKAESAFYESVIKKELAKQAAAFYYKLYYCDQTHKNFIKNAANSSNNIVSGLLYNQVYTNLTTLQNTAKEKYDVSDGKIETSNSVAKYADYANTIAEAVSLVSYIPGAGTAIGTTAKIVAVAAKAVKTIAHGKAVYDGISGCLDIATLSEQILPKTNFTNIRTGSGSRTFHNNSQQSPDTLLARKNSFNQKLIELKTIYNAPAYDSAAYFNKLGEYATADSLYTDEMDKTLNALWASADSAVLLIPNFSGKLNKVIDSFVSKQYILRNSFFYQNMAYMFDADKSVDTAELNSLANQIMIFNDSAVNGIAYLAGDINTNGVAAPAYLVQDNYTLNHNYVPGSSGNITYTFKNYGTQPQNNVSFKLVADVPAGYVFTSTDSVNVGTILPGESKQITFNFTSPLNDSICRYTIDVNANNGSFRDVTGSLYVKDSTKFYTVKDGNWNDISTWSRNVIPSTSTNVVVSHAITVNVDVICNSIIAINPGTITVSAGKQLKVLH